MARYKYDLGTYHRGITTSSQDARFWFDRGLVWSYGFNHEEALYCFRRAAKADPACAMAHWGIAYAAGPNYNKQWKAFDPVDLKRSLGIARKATQEALARLDGASPEERALIGTLAERYPSANAAEVTPE